MILLNIPGPVIIVILFLLAGLALLFSALVLLFRARNTHHWRNVNGQILSAEVEKRQKRSGNHGTQTIYRPKITYSYKVDDKELQSSRIKILHDYSGSSPEKVQEVLNKYSVGSNHKVYYDPLKPERSVLETGTSGNIYALLVMGTLILTGTYFLARNLNLIESIN